MNLLTHKMRVKPHANKTHQKAVLEIGTGSESARCLSPFPTTGAAQLSFTYLRLHKVSLPLIHHGQQCCYKCGKRFEIPWLTLGNGDRHFEDLEPVSNSGAGFTILGNGDRHLEDLEPVSNSGAGFTILGNGDRHFEDLEPVSNSGAGLTIIGNGDRPGRLRDSR